MQTLPLTLDVGLIFVEISGNKWLLDTGAPTSFGDTSQLLLDGKEFTIGNDFLGINKSSLSKNIAVNFEGLLGNDVLSEFDFIFDVRQEKLTVSTETLNLDGHRIQFTELMGTPIFKIKIRDQEFSVFFDTGAEINYILNNVIRNFEPMGKFDDFHPMFGEFSTDTYNVQLTIDDIPFTLQCGTLPDEASMLLRTFGVEGIVGNSILRDRVLGYFPRRGVVVL